LEQHLNLSIQCLVQEQDFLVVVEAVAYKMMQVTVVHEVQVV
tara:strand:- start:189 stop:314 length:126 start_codon:yes stop_codon:yes gene_type:complete